MEKHHSAIISYEHFEEQVLEHLGALRDQDGDEFHFEIREQLPGTRHSQSDNSYDIVEHTAHGWLQEMDGNAQLTAFLLQVMNLSTGKGLRALWAWKGGSVIETTQEPRLKKQ